LYHRRKPCLEQCTDAERKGVETHVDLIAMAWRNVWRNRRRSLVTVAAMSLALLVMILYTGLIEGYLEGMERNVLDLEVGDVQVFAGDYRRNPSIYTKIDDSERLLERLEEAGFPASGRLLAFGLAAADEASAGASFRGLDVARDLRSVRSRISSIEGDGSTPPIRRASSSVAGWPVRSTSISAESCWSSPRVRTAAWPTNSTT